MRIRQEQFLEFEKAVASQADARLARYARERFPERFLHTPDDELAAFVADIRRGAREHLIFQEPDVAIVLDLSVMYGASFYGADWARDVFEINDWSGAQKLEVVRERVRRQIPEF